MLAVLRQRNFGLLWWGQLISMLGDWAIYAALPFYIYQLTGSVLATGTMFIMLTAPMLLFGSIAGVFVDRWDWRWTMIGANLLRGLLLLLLLTVRSVETIWVVYLVAFLEAAVTQFFGPANNALLPHLVGEEQLLAANSLDGFAENCARLLGPALAGVLLSTFGLKAVVWLDIGSYLVAALMVYLIVAPVNPVSKASQPAAAAGPAWVAVWQEWLAGLRLVLNTRPLAVAILVFGIALFGDSIITVLLAAYIQKMVGAGAAEYAWVLTARGIGGIVGGILVGHFGKYFKNGQLIGYGLAGTGLMYFAMFHWPVLPAVLLNIALLGLPVMAWLIAGQTWMQTHAPDGYRGRVFGIEYATCAFMMLLGMGLGSSVGDRVNLVAVSNITVVLYLVAGGIALLGLREAEALQPVKILSE